MKIEVIELWNKLGKKLVLYGECSGIHIGP